MLEAGLATAGDKLLTGAARMGSAEIFVPPTVYNHPIEIALLERLRTEGEDLVARYLSRHTKDGVSFIGRDAAKRMFPEYLENPTVHNRYTDGAASALADAARRTLLLRRASASRNRVHLLTGAPASGKTSSAGPLGGRDIEIKHETILTSTSRASELIEQALSAGRNAAIQLFYTDDPRIHVQRMIARARRIGRTIPLKYMAQRFVDVPSIVAAVKREFGRNLEILVTNNSETPENAVHHHRLERALYHVNRYTEASALEAMYAELLEIKSGAEGIPEAILEEACRG